MFVFCWVLPTCKCGHEDRAGHSLCLKNTLAWVFFWNLGFCKNCAEPEEERSDEKFQHHSAFPAFPSPREKKSPREYAVLSKRVDHYFVLAAFKLCKLIIQMHLVEPVVSYLFALQLLLLLLWSLPLLLKQASHYVFKQKRGYPFWKFHKTKLPVKF